MTLTSCDICLCPLAAQRNSPAILRTSCQLPATLRALGNIDYPQDFSIRTPTRLNRLVPFRFQPLLHHEYEEGHAQIWSAFTSANATIVENEKRRYFPKHLPGSLKSNYDFLVALDTKTVANLVRCTEAILFRMYPCRVDMPGI